MRISDWSSDVCSSDLNETLTKTRPRTCQLCAFELRQTVSHLLAISVGDEIDVPSAPMRAGNRGQAFRVEPDRSLRKDDLRTFLRRDKRADGSLDDRAHLHPVGDRLHSPCPARPASRQRAPSTEKARAGK